MDRLWATWRIGYVGSKRKKCIFCLNQKAKNDKKHYIIKRGNYAFSMLNIYPYNNGHMMIAPYRHIKDFDRLRDEEIIDIMKLVKKSYRLLKKILKPQGFNIGINIGDIAGAGFAGHFHVHIVPRWKGDVNFMSTTAGTKVIAESLEELYARLTQPRRAGDKPKG